jgi:membrane protein YdbS with pleckstrin-like domain
MGRAEDWLEPGERVMFRTGLHPMAFAGALSLALFVALVVVLLIRHNDLPPVTEAQIVVVGVLVAVLGSVPALLRWRRTALFVTDRRLLVRSGTYRQHLLATPLAPGIVEQESGTTGRMLDHGTVTVVGPDGQMIGVAHVARARELVEVAHAQARRSATARRSPASS